MASEDGSPSGAMVSSSPLSLDAIAEAEPTTPAVRATTTRSEEHTSELQSPCNLVCRLLLEVRVAPRALLSFPTRRSSDLMEATVDLRSIEVPLTSNVQWMAVNGKRGWFTVWSDGVILPVVAGCDSGSGADDTGGSGDDNEIGRAHV